jgi:hypothetical protein
MMRLQSVLHELYFFWWSECIVPFLVFLSRSQISVGVDVEQCFLGGLKRLTQSRLGDGFSC